MNIHTLSFRDFKILSQTDQFHLVDVIFSNKLLMKSWEEEEKVFSAKYILWREVEAEEVEVEQEGEEEEEEVEAEVQEDEVEAEEEVQEEEVVQYEEEVEKWRTNF